MTCEAEASSAVLEKLPYHETSGTRADISGVER